MKGSENHKGHLPGSTLRPHLALTNFEICLRLLEPFLTTHWELFICNPFKRISSFPPISSISVEDFFRPQKSLIMLSRFRYANGIKWFFFSWISEIFGCVKHSKCGWLLLHRRYYVAREYESWRSCWTWAISRTPGRARLFLLHQDWPLQIWAYVQI